jgi:hypothetical protein
MNSYPLIETALGQTERRFIEFVEEHAVAKDLPDDTVRLRIATSIDGDSYEALHSIEVVGQRGRVWRIEHSLRRSELRQKGAGELETRFALTGPGVPEGYGRRAEIEAVVDAALGAMSDALDAAPSAVGSNGKRAVS